MCVCLSRGSSSLQEPPDGPSRLEIGRDPRWRAAMSAETAMHPADQCPGDTFLPAMIGAHQKAFFIIIGMGTHNVDFLMGYFTAIDLIWWNSKLLTGCLGSKF